MSSDGKAKRTLSDSDITTDRTKIAPGRRGFLGLMAVGGVAAGSAALTGTQAQAQATDNDSGAWNDDSGCGRGPGGTYTGATDADNGNITDAGGHGRGAPTC